MKRILAIFLTAMLVACSSRPNLENLKNLNGYWEISEVEKPKGNIISYTYNATIDYFELTDSLAGFRKKLMPQLDGTFQENGTAESITIEMRDDTLKIIYSTPYSTWEESILKLNETELELVNTDKVRYFYKRFAPINLKE